ncbi:MAG TPA: DNA replication/repair protein RecF [Acidimicrobiales bacterium]|nr:DNA replication/repair protein RecF [Acidimicrobiales bacterium]
MLLRHLWLTDFRNYHQAEVELPSGLTAIVGDNGQGKSNLLEAVGYLATLGSFRGAPVEALVRQGTSTATVRAEVEREGRDLLIEAELAPRGRNRIQVNRQRLHRSRDLLGALRVSVFAPDDLALVKEGPAERRRYLDDALVAAQPRLDGLRGEVDRVLRQRNALLRQCHGRLDADAALTLDVWDAKLVAAAEELVRERIGLLDQLRPSVSDAYARLATTADRSSGPSLEVAVSYRSAWLGQGLEAALAEGRVDDVRRGMSLVGPHRDDVDLSIGGMPARTHASQGEQRSLALALRLAAHEVVGRLAGSPPVLLLDDVFSELDPHRSRALLESLGPAQTLLTTAGALPDLATPERVLRVHDGTVHVV